MSAVTKLKFDFKTMKIKDDNGKVIGNGKKRPSVELELPIPVWEEVCAFPEGSAERNLVLESITDTIYGQARNQINEAIKAAEESGSEIVINQEVLKMDELTWSFIANMPPARRGAAKIDDEAWTAFSEDYVSTMVQISPYKEPQLKGQADVFCDRFNSKGIKGNKKIIALLKQLLEQWFAASTAAEEHFQIYKFLSNKAENILNENAEKKMEELFGAVVGAEADPVEEATV